MSERIYIYKRYERFWHWSQALLIIIMMITGFEVHGSYALLGFQKAVQLHSLAAWTLLTLWAFTIFWQFTTGEWRQYIPSLKNVGAMIKYYTVGIFTNAQHPFQWIGNMQIVGQYVVGLLFNSLDLCGFQKPIHRVRLR